jgi:ferredoxin
LLEATGLGQFAISIEEKEKSKEPMLSRREIFSTISNKAKNKAASFLHHREKAIRKKLAGNLQRKRGNRLSPDRELLLKLLKPKGWENEKVLEYKPEFPWGKIKIEKKNCSGCGTCVALCPTVAISKKLKNEQQFLFFNSSLCTNCSLCKEACPQGAIDFEENFALSDILEEEAKVVAKIKLASCFICGEIIKAGKGKLCPTCEKRQVWPAYVKV